MQKWEYDTVYLHYDQKKRKSMIESFDKQYDDRKSMLKAMGEEGWEMVGTSVFAPSERLYFKRPIEE